MLHLCVFLLSGLVIWEGDFHDNAHWDFQLGTFEQALVLIFSDFVVAASFALLLRYLLHEELSSGISPLVLTEKFFSLWIWHPLAQLSYCGYLLTPVSAYYAFRFLGGVDSVETGYVYFAKIYFATLGINLCGAFLLNIFLETPLMKIVRYT